MASTDRDALLALYNATGGPNWSTSTNWDTDADLSQWIGVNVNGQGRVVKLLLAYNNLRGGLGAATAGKTFALLIEYSHDTNEIDMKATRPGHKLLLGNTCSSCSSETGGLGAAAVDLLEMVDVLQSRGDIFRSIQTRFVKLQDEYPVLNPAVSRDLHPAQTQRQVSGWLRGMKSEMKTILDGAQESCGEGAKFQQLVGDLQQQLEQQRFQQLVGDLQQQLEQQHQDVREWLGALGERRLADVIDADDGVVGRLDFIVAMLVATRKEGSDTPRRACVLPPWKFAQTHGLSGDEQMPEVWVKRLDEWREDDFKEGKGFFKKKKRLFLVCAHTHRLVPCGPNGQGYDIEERRTWFRMSVSIATFALQVLCTTLSAMAVVPLSGAGAAVEATVSAAVGNFDSMLQNQMAGLTLDDDAAAVEVLDDDGADMTVASKTAQLEGSVYASLREFVHGEELTARLEIFKASKKAHRRRRAPPSSSAFVFFAQAMTQVQSGDGDAAVQWVLKGQEHAWHDANGRAPTT